MGKLIYFACNTRPDIVFTVEQLRKQNSDLRKDYLQAAKRVVQYLKETMQLELTVGKRPDWAPHRDSSLYDLLNMQTVIL